MLKIINSKIALGSSIVVAATALVVGATFAFFTDSETSQGNILQAGALDLKIDNTSYYNGVLNEDTTWTLNDLTDQLFFDFTDVKPNDIGEDTISFHVENDSWVCAELTLTENNDNTCVANETPDDLSCTEPNIDLFDGELAQNIEFAFWTDDGDNVLETDEEIISSGSAQNVLDSEITIADSLTNNIGGADGEPLPGGQTRFIAKAWCFGDLSLNPVTAGEGVNPTVDGGVLCNGSSLNNAAQSDKVLADIQFTAVQARHNSSFVCGAQVTPTETPTPTPPQISCEAPAAIFATGFSDNNQGLRKNGTAILADRTDPNDALGAPQSAGLPSDSPVVAGSFFSLGFPHTNNGNVPGNLVLDMGEPFYPNPSGNDILVYEVTGGVYPDETVAVEAKLNPGDPWTSLGNITRDGGVELSVGSLASARYLRLTETSNIAPFEATADGYDLDAVKAFCTATTQ